jgi:transcriptional regulator with XRE-family HTH domain
MPPHPVELVLRRWGANLRTARVRRQLTIEQVAERIGTGPRAVADAEKGKPSTAVATYVALLWSFGLLADAERLAAPELDAEGLALARTREPLQPRTRRAELDDDF